MKEYIQEVAKKSKKVVGFWVDFMKFLKEFSVLGVAIGLVIGNAVTALVGAIISGLITPFIQLLLPDGELKSLSYEVNGVVFQVGNVISAMINFVVVAFLMFFVAKFFIYRGKEITKDLFKK